MQVAENAIAFPALWRSITLLPVEVLYRDGDGIELSDILEAF